MQSLALKIKLPPCPERVQRGLPNTLLWNLGQQVSFGGLYGCLLILSSAAEYHAHALIHAHQIALLLPSYASARSFQRAAWARGILR